jgi:hypothetical protein
MQDQTSHETDSGQNNAIGRRRVLGRVGAAVVGLVGATALVEAAAGPAEAADGSAVKAGATTTAEQGTTVKFDGAAGFNGNVLLGNDTNYSNAGAFFPAALGGWAGNTVANGIYGFTSNANGNAVVGKISSSSTGSGAGVAGVAADSGQVGVKGTNTMGTGVLGSSDSTASDATAILGEITSTAPGSFSSAVRGQNNGTGGNGIGVYGSQAGSGWGVYGTSVGGIGVNGVGGSGVGVQASADPPGTALNVIGTAAFSRSGTVTIPSGQKTATVTPTGGLTGSSLVFAVLQNLAGGVTVKAAVPDAGAGTFQIVLNKPPRSPATAIVAWFVVN